MKKQEKKPIKNVKNVPSKTKKISEKDLAKVTGGLPGAPVPSDFVPFDTN